MEQHDKKNFLELSHELERFRVRLWDQYITLRTIYGQMPTTFDQLWYDFLLQYLQSENQIAVDYHLTCRKFEQRVSDSLQEINP